MTMPNVLWISTHDINPHLGCYAGIWPGAEQATTPTLDRLAADGLRFDKAMATAPVCAPARSSIMTGQFTTAIGTMHMRTSAVPPDETVLLPQLFRAAGYHTTNNWFTDFQMEIPNPVFDACSTRAHWRDRLPGQSFFAMVHLLTTHESQIYLDEARYGAATAHVPDDARVDPATVQLPPYHPDTEPFRTAWARYLDLICEMDHRVGEILADLESDGLADDTIVVFWSDHGLGLPGGKRWANEVGFREPLIVRWPGRIEPGTTVAQVVSTMDLAPTMLAMCGLPVPAHMHGQVLLDATGAVSDDLRPYAYSARDRMDEQLDASRSIRDDRFRYTRHLHPDRPAMSYLAYADHLATWAELRRLVKQEAMQDLSFGRPGSLLTPAQRRVVDVHGCIDELYDLDADPFEERNLAGDPAYADDLSRLSAALDAWLDTVGDLGRLPEGELLERWRPGGVPRRTAPVTATWSAGEVTLACETPGAVVGWTPLGPDTPKPAPDGLPIPIAGFDDDGRSWRLYGGAFRPDGDVWAKAWRIGYEPSADLPLHPETATGPA